MTSLVLLFGFVVLFGAPYLPTLRAQRNDIFALAELRSGDKLLELGSGDGRVLRAAAKRGIKATGYEINPLLVVYSRLITWRYRSLVTIKWANFWRATLPDADAIYVFLLDKYMSKLDNKITQEFSNNVKLVSFAFKVPNKVPSKVRRGMYVYEYKKHDLLK